MQKAYNYSDIYLVPEFSGVMSRKDVDVGIHFLGRKYKLPVIPANMSSVINEEIAHWLSENDYFYIYHRFDPNIKELIRKMNLQNWKLKSISIGVKEQDYQLIEWLSHYTSYKLDVITIDVAHGHHLMVKNMIDHIKIHLLGTKIIAGNVCTLSGVKCAEIWGADAVKVGIAGGGACSTKNQTGFHIPMFSCVKECYERGGTLAEHVSERAKIPIIADGGIRENGDIAKAIRAGATMVMAGSIFAACKDSPGEDVIGRVTLMGNGNANPEITHKRYFGSASAKQKGERKNVEGFEVDIPCNGLTYSEKYQEIMESLQSAFSYAGGTLEHLKRVEYVYTK